MESSISGFKITGSWEDVVEHGEKIESILETVEEGDSYEIDGELVEEFNEWRPKVREVGSESKISDKTAEKAAVSKSDSEEKNKNVSEDIGDAASEAGKSVSELSDSNIESSWEHWKSTTNYMTRATDTVWRRYFRKVEKFVYKHLMTIVSPYYFDNELVSANIQRKSESTYVFEININDDKLKSRVESIMIDLDERDRWHLDHEHMSGNPDKVHESEGTESIRDTPSMDLKVVRDEIQEEFEKSDSE